MILNLKVKRSKAECS